MNIRGTDRKRLQEAFDDVITGVGAKRAKVDLLFDGKDLTNAFIEALDRNGYKRGTVEAINIQPGERVPAFYIENVTAYFGWVFWEKFTEKKMRKLWGSVVRNQKGDWAIQIPPTKPTLIYANERAKIEMDIDRPE